MRASRRSVILHIQKHSKSEAKKLNMPRRSELHIITSLLSKFSHYRKHYETKEEKKTLKNINSFYNQDPEDKHAQDTTMIREHA